MPKQAKHKKAVKRGPGRPRIFEGPSVPFSTRVPVWLLKSIATLAAAEGLSPATMRRELVLRGFKQTMRKLANSEVKLVVELLRKNSEGGEG